MGLEADTGGARGPRAKTKGRGDRILWINEKYIEVRGHWEYLCRALDRDGALVDVMPSEHRDFAAPKVLFERRKRLLTSRRTRPRLTATASIHGRSERSSASASGIEHKPTSITSLNRSARHEGATSTDARLQEQRSTKRYCGCHDELRTFLPSRSHVCQHVAAPVRRFHQMHQAAIAPCIAEAGYTRSSCSPITAHALA